MLTDIPKYIGGAKALYISKLNPAFCNVVRFNTKILIEFICVCQYENETGFYLFGCDKNFDTHTDYYYDDLDDALDDAKQIYQIETIEWKQIN